jgi:hypothetical protein
MEQGYGKLFYDPKEREKNRRPKTSVLLLSREAPGESTTRRESNISVKKAPIDSTKVFPSCLKKLGRKKQKKYNCLWSS